MSGGAYDYLCFSDGVGLVPDALQRMADRLAGLPYAQKAAEDTAAVIELTRAAGGLAERLTDVWHAVEWRDSGDCGDDDMQTEIAKYETRDNTDPYEVPDRTHLIGKPVTVSLRHWARQGPTQGVFAGQGEHGFTLRLVGGGRWLWFHHETCSIDQAEEG